MRLIWQILIINTFNLPSQKANIVNQKLTTSLIRIFFSRLNEWHEHFVNNESNMGYADLIFCIELGREGLWLTLQLHSKKIIKKYSTLGRENCTLFLGNCWWIFKIGWTLSFFLFLHRYIVLCVQRFFFSIIFQSLLLFCFPNMAWTN